MLARTAARSLRPALRATAPKALAPMINSMPVKHMSDDAAAAPAPARFGPTIEVIISKSMCLHQRGRAPSVCCDACLAPAFWPHMRASKPQALSFHH